MPAAARRPLNSYIRCAGCHSKHFVHTSCLAIGTAESIDVECTECRQRLSIAAQFNFHLSWTIHRFLFADGAKPNTLASSVSVGSEIGFPIFVIVTL